MSAAFATVTPRRAHAARHSPASLALRVRGYAFPPLAGLRGPRPPTQVRWRAPGRYVGPPHQKNKTKTKT